MKNYKKISFWVVVCAVFVGANALSVNTARANGFTDFWARLFTWRWSKVLEVKNATSTSNTPGTGTSKDNTPVKNPWNSKASMIHSVSGPDVLKVGERGTWVVKASDPLKRTLGYTVVWGDEGPRAPAPTVEFAQTKIYLESQSFTHAYQIAGVYNPVFILRNETGFEASKSVSVRVGQDNTPAKVMPITVRTNKNVYAPSEDIVVIITAQNNTGADKTLQFNSGCQVSYMIGGYDSADSQACIMMLTSLTIPKGESHTWTVTHDDTKFRHVEGTYKVVGRVIGYGESETSLIIKADNPNSPITVGYPNGGETFTFGSNQRIYWKTPNVQTLSTFRAETYDINLLPYYPPCDSKKALCPMYAYQAPFSIAKNVIGNEYNWSVGAVVDQGRILNSAKYQVQVCFTGGGYCDVSDEPFTISK